MFLRFVNRQRLYLLPLVCTVVLSGCGGGTKLLKEPQPIPELQPLASASDRQVTATLDWVIVRDGPGTWARNADWDEYLMRVSNRSDQPIEVTGVIVVDSIDTRVESQPGRKQLVKASKETARRYDKSGIDVKAGYGADTLIGAGAVVTGVGLAGTAALSSATIVSGITTGGAAAGAMTAVGGLVVLGPVLAVNGIVRSVNNNEVNEHIELRQTKLPAAVAAGEELLLNVFFPITPSPRMLEILYSDANGDNSLVVETSSALDGLHLETSTE